MQIKVEKIKLEPLVETLHGWSGWILRKRNGNAGLVDNLR